MSGPWERDLELDLDAVRDWGATAVVTLVEKTELAQLRAERIGEAVRRHKMKWFHLPIVDGSVPDRRFEREWDSVGKELRSLLRSANDVVAHCKGGLGRAGMIAARLLVELGMNPECAIRLVRSMRPGAIETRAQERHVLGIVAQPE